MHVYMGNNNFVLGQSDFNLMERQYELSCSDQLQRNRVIFLLNKVFVFFVDKDKEGNQSSFLA